MADWYTIEVLDGVLPAGAWQRGYGETVTGAAVSGGAVDWSWHEFDGGVALELLFPEEADWERFCSQPVVAAALDAVPDRVNGVLLYKGRGGSSGRPAPRRPRPIVGAGAAELPEPVVEELAEAVAAAVAGGAGTAVRPHLRLVAC